MRRVRRVFALSVLLCCIATTALNQFVTQTSVSRLEATQAAAEDCFDDMALMYQMFEARQFLVRQIEKIASLADSERIRADKAEFTLERAKDHIVRQQGYIDYLLKHEAIRKRNPAVPLMTFEDFVKTQ